MACLRNGRYVKKQERGGTTALATRLSSDLMESLMSPVHKIRLQLCRAAQKKEAERVAGGALVFSFTT